MKYFGQKIKLESDQAYYQFIFIYLFLLCYQFIENTQGRETCKRAPWLISEVQIVGNSTGQNPVSLRNKLKEIKEKCQKTEESDLSDMPINFKL